jgi:hypothetical protein
MKPSGNGSAAYNRKKWNILFIGEDGKVVTVKHFKGIVAALVVLLVCLTVAVVVLYYQYQNRTGDVEILRKDMAGVKEENHGLREEKDQMLARLVILESKLKTREERGPYAGIGQSPGKSAPPKDAVDEEEPQGASPEEPKGVPKDAGTTAMAGGQTQLPPVSIANRNLIVCQDPDSEFMRVEYKVMNIGANDTPVAGRSVIVLKGDNMNPEDWIVLPNVPLADLKPSGERGKRFRIYNFRTLKYKINSSAVKGRLETATIFTFTEEGKLLMERDYPLEMSAEMCP